MLSARVPLPPPLRYVDPRPGGGGDRPVEDVHDPHVQPPRVEVLGVANDGGHPPFPCGAGGVKAEEPVQKVPHAADQHDVSIRIGYFEYDVNDGNTGAAGHGLTASYDEVMCKAF